MLPKTITARFQVSTACWSSQQYRGCRLL